MNGDKAQDVCSMAESVLRRFEEVLSKAREIRGEARVIVRLVTGSDGESSKKEVGEKIKTPDSILAFLGDKAEQIWTELIALDSNLEHLKKRIGTDRFENPSLPKVDR